MWKHTVVPPSRSDLCRFLRMSLGKRARRVRVCGFPFACVRTDKSEAASDLPSASAPTCSPSVSVVFVDYRGCWFWNVSLPSSKFDWSLLLWEDEPLSNFHYDFPPCLSSPYLCPHTQSVCRCGRFNPSVGVWHMRHRKPYSSDSRLSECNLNLEEVGEGCSKMDCSIRLKTALEAALMWCGGADAFVGCHWKAGTLKILWKSNTTTWKLFKAQESWELECITVRALVSKDG